MSSGMPNMPPGAMPNIVPKMPNMPPGPMPNAAPKMMGGRRMYMRGVTMRKRKGGRRSSTRRQRGGQMPNNNSNSSNNNNSGNSMTGGGKTLTVGSKAQVWHGSAKHTSGGLTKKDLMKHKGRIVSKKKHALGKKAIRRLAKAGYKAKKGTFKLFRK